MDDKTRAIFETLCYDDGVPVFETFKALTPMERRFVYLACGFEALNNILVRAGITTGPEIRAELEIQILAVGTSKITLDTVMSRMALMPQEKSTEVTNGKEESGKESGDSKGTESAKRKEG